MPGPGLEAHEAVRLGRGGVDDLPDVDAHAVGEHRHLVDERDVHRAEDVLQQLGQLGGLGRRDADDRVADAARRARSARSAHASVSPPTTFGVVAQRVVGAAGVDALGREREVEVAARRRGRTPRASARRARASCPGRSSTRARRAGRAAARRRARAWRRSAGRGRARGSPSAASGRRRAPRRSARGAAVASSPRCGRRPPAGARTGCPRCRSRRRGCASILRASVSSATTSWPSSAKATASGRPT